MTKINSEITTLILLLILDFELFTLMFDCYFVHPTNNMGYLLGSASLLALICAITATCCKKKEINGLIDKLENETR